MTAAMEAIASMRTSASARTIATMVPPQMRTAIVQTIVVAVALGEAIRPCQRSTPRQDLTHGP